MAVKPEITKEYILGEIKRTALANGGVALGRIVFLRETGIREVDWHGKWWARWGDAIAEAGFVPNELKAAYKEDEVLEKLVELIKEFGRFPVIAEIKMVRRKNDQFPSYDAIRRIGNWSQIAQKMVGYCERHEGLENVARIALSVVEKKKNDTDEDDSDEEESADGVTAGFVYLLKAGKFYKIGRTNAFGRRRAELGIQLPEMATTVHIIETDDAAGIETYWHRRFASKRANGEWFALNSADVKAFKRRKFM